MEKITFEKMLEAVKKAHPMWALGNVYRFDKRSNFYTFEEWIEELYKEIKK